MNRKLLALFFLAGSALFARTHSYVGFGVGGYYAPPPVYAYVPAPVAPPVAAYAVPPSPGPGYSWISGYYYPVGPRWVWRPGYWGARPFAGAVWVGPRYYGHRYYAGYWRR